MTHYFFSRRTFHRNRFTHNLSETTRYLAFDDINQFERKAHYSDPASWATHVLQAAGGGDVVCFVHGYNTDQKEMAERMLAMDAGLRATGQFHGVVVGFDWPSDGRMLNSKDLPNSKRRSAYEADKTDANNAAPYLIAGGLDALLPRMPAGSKLHLVAHSMGARVTTRSFERTSNAAFGQWSLGEVVFVAADIDRPELETGNGYSLVMDLRSSRFTNYASGFDDILEISSHLYNHSRERLGRSGLPSLTPSSFHGVDCGDHYRSKGPTVFDAKRSHRWYFEDPAFYQDLAKTLNGDPSGKNRVLGA